MIKDDGAIALCDYIKKLKSLKSFSIDLRYFCLKNTIKHFFKVILLLTFNKLIKLLLVQIKLRTLKRSKPTITSIFLA